MWAEVEDALKQLAANPLFAANPACLGELMERLVHGAAEKALTPETVTPEPTPSKTSGKSGTESEDGGGSEVYKNFWSKFKRPSNPHMASEPMEKTAKRDAVVVDSQTPLREQPPDNQLGDSSLYPPSPPPSTPATASTAAQAAQVEQKQAAAVPEQALTETKQVPEEIAGTTHANGHGQPEPSTIKVSASCEKAMDEMFGPTPGEETSDEKKRQFSPTSADVTACLMRKTTADLALESMPGHCQVLMSLAGAWQPVWVPLQPEQAIAAGLQLYDATAVAATLAAPVTHGQAPEATTPVAGGQAEATMTPTETLASEPAAEQIGAPAEKTPGSEPKNTPGQAPPGEARSSNDGQRNQPTENTTREADSKAALKNGYMRFHRSVTSALDASSNAKVKLLNNSYMSVGCFFWCLVLLYGHILRWEVSSWNCKQVEGDQRKGCLGCWVSLLCAAWFWIQIMWCIILLLFSDYI